MTAKAVSRVRRQKKQWNFRKANWDNFSASTEKSIPIISRYGIPVDEAYSHFTRAISKTTHSTVLRRVRTMYVPCMDEDAHALWDEYEKSGDPDIADHLIESLDSTRRARWESQQLECYYYSIQ